MENTLLTTKDVAEKIGVSVNRVQAMIRANRLPAIRIGRDFVVKESDLALVLDRKAGRPKKEPEIEIAPGGKKWKAEQQPLPEVSPTTKRAATMTAASKTKAVATKKGGKK